MSDNKIKYTTENTGDLIDKIKLCRTLKQFRDAEELINENPDLLENSSEIKFELANIYSELGEFDKAISVFEELLKKDEIEVNIAANELVKLYARKGDHKKAVEFIDSVLKNKNADESLYADKIIQQRFIPDGHGAGETYRKIKNIENEKIKKIVQSITSVEESRREIPPYRVFFTWGMHYKCNYNCSYCYAPKPHDITFDNNKNNKAAYPSKQQIIDSWSFVYDKYGMCRIRLDGGEPTIYPDFYDIIRDLQKIHKLQINTNLSFDVEKFCADANPERVKIDASLHCEYAGLEEFVKKLEYLKKHGYKTVVSYVAYPDFINNIPIAKKIIEHDLGIPFIIHPYSGFYDDIQYPAAYTQEQKNIIYNTDYKSITELSWRAERKGNYKTAKEKANNMKLTEEQIVDGENKKIAEQKENKKNNEFKLCEMGRMYARIYPNGNVYRCCAYDGNTYLGNLFDKTLKLLETAEKCYDIKKCRCWRCMVPGEEPRWLHTWMDDWETEIAENK